MDKEKDKELNLVIGNFEILHQGHRYLFEHGAKCTVITFHGIPRKKDNLAYTDMQKANNICAVYNNVDGMYLCKCDYAHETAEQFAKFLKKELNPTRVFVGEDFKFGCDFKGVDFLSKYFKVMTVPYNKEYSTTKIKKLISEGQIAKANEMMLVKFHVIGKVVKGKQLGRKLGYKTANIIRKKKFLKIAPGVYSGYTFVYDKKFESKLKSAISVRNLPSGDQLIESHIINKNYPDFYNKRIMVSFNGFINELQESKNEQELKNIVKNNVVKVNKVFMN